jgi:putative ABC transport system substrate-binding protein
MSNAIRRKILIATGALLGAPFISQAQGQKRLPALGILSLGSKSSPSTSMSPFDKRLIELGWIEGKTLIIERVYAENAFDRLPELAAMLVAKKVDVIWTSSPLGAIAAARATTSIPIVFWRVGAPVEFGLIDSLARPGRNVTGVAWFADASIYTKRYQILREMAPHARRLASLGATGAVWRTVSGEIADFQAYVAQGNAAARDQGFEFRRFEIGKPTDFEPVLDAIAQWKADSLFVQDSPQTIRERKRIIEFARRHRLIDIYETLEWTQAGGLVSYGIVFEPTLVRTADYVDRILRGAKPADLPVELPSHYELAVNLGTAKALRHAVPQSILLRANKVIE